jgi:hypothetical protein
MSVLKILSGTLLGADISLDEKCQWKTVECDLQTKLKKIMTNNWMKLYTTLKKFFCTYEVAILLVGPK